jgi:hypothetical protein
MTKVLKVKQVAEEINVSVPQVYQGSSQQWRKFEPYLNGALDQLTELN